MTQVKLLHSGMIHFLPVVNKRSPLRRKRVKDPKLPPWLTKDIIQAMDLRNTLKRDKLFDLYKKQGNKVSTSVLQLNRAILTN